MMVAGKGIIVNSDSQFVVSFGQVSLYAHTRCLSKNHPQGDFHLFFSALIILFCLFLPGNRPGGARFFTSSLRRPAIRDAWSFCPAVQAGRQHGLF